MWLGTFYKGSSDSNQINKSMQTKYEELGGVGEYTLPKFEDLLPAFTSLTITPVDKEVYLGIWPEENFEKLTCHEYGIPWIHDIISELNEDYEGALFCEELDPDTGYKIHTTFYQVYPGKKLEIIWRV